MIKKFNYLLFRLIYPKPKKITKVNNKEVLDIKIGISKYKVYQIKACRLYTDTIHTMGIIKNDKELIDGPSYQIKNNNFSSIKNNKILQIGTPRIIRKLKGTIFSMLTGGGGNENYYHWLFDVLPRLRMIENKVPIKNIDYFLLPAIKKRFHFETLSALGIPMKKILSSELNRHIFADKIIVTSHPYRFTQNIKKDTYSLPSWISIWLKKKFLKKKSNKILYKKIFIDRKNSEYTKYGRSIVNNGEIKNFLRNQGFKPLLLEHYSFADQICIFNNAKVIVGLHGAGFANLVFCKKGTKIIEIMSKTSGNQIRNMAYQNKLKYISLVGKSKVATSSQQGNLEISLKELKKKLNIKY
jgi:capsular polysaccharide biosynthesis protein